MNNAWNFNTQQFLCIIVSRETQKHKNTDFKGIVVHDKG